MASRVGRRNFVGGMAGMALAAGLPMPAIAQGKPIRIGLLTVKTGPLAQGGIQMEQGTRRSNRPCATTASTHSVSLDFMFLIKLNPVEPPCT